MSASASTPSQRLPYGKLLVLAGAIFVSVSSEFLPTGLLPDIAGDLRISESRVGLLVTLFAGTVAVTSFPLALATRPLGRKHLLVVTLVIFAISNVGAALAPTYELLAAARVVGGLAHGLFWAVMNPYIALLVPRHQLARAIALTNAGGSMAFIVGVPLTAALGHALGWRLAFGVMAGTVILFVVFVALLLPHLAHRIPLATGEIPVPLHRDRSLLAVGIVAGTVLLVATGHNTFYTYIAPWSIGVGGVDPDLVSVVLLGFGVAGLLGLLVSGALGDRRPRLVMLALIALLVVMMAVLAWVARGLPAVIVGMALWSFAFGGLPALFHTRSLMGASMRVREVSGAIMTTAFNLSIGLGALIGGVVLDGWGIAAVPVVGLLIVVVGLVYTGTTDRARIAAHPAQAHRG